jgi:hypothetical protein
MKSLEDGSEMLTFMNRAPAPFHDLRVPESDPLISDRIPFFPRLLNTIRQSDYYLITVRKSTSRSLNAR